MESLLNLSKKTLKRRLDARVVEVQNEIESLKTALKIPKFAENDEDDQSSQSSDSECGSISSHDSSYSDWAAEDDVDECTEGIIDLIRDLFVEFNVNAVFVNRLLSILRTAGLEYFPKTYTTLMKTDGPKPEIQVYPDGKYVHFGLENQMVDKLNLLETAPNETIKLNVNIDGTPNTNSSGNQFWPVLGSIQIPSIKEPFEIGIFASPSVKPKETGFLNEFVQEAKLLQNNGLSYKDTNIKFMVNLFVCDTPANSFILKTKGHTGFECCRKCIVHGITIKNRRVFPEMDEDLRTDFDFRHQLYPNHHIGTSILTELDIDMVKNVPLDYMHLVLLGVMKKLLSFWVLGVKTGPKKLSADLIVILEQNLAVILMSQPDEFCRRIRSTFQLIFWKATEYRTFLLYCGPIALENVLPPREYQHFLKLHCAIHILLKDERLVYIDKANQFLREFVSEMLLVKNPLYGNQFVGYNFHNLIHLTDEVRNNGHLDKFSTFPFENRLFFLKKRLRSGNLPLEQTINRLREHKAFRRQKTKDSTKFPRVSRPSSNGEFKKIELNEDLLLDVTKKKQILHVQQQ
jgi:hypothetical protein